MITISYFKEKPKSPVHIGKSTPIGLSPFPSDYVDDNNLNNLRPFKTSSNDLSFEGLSFKGGKKELISVSKAVKKYAEEFGDTSADYFENKMRKAASVEGSGLKIKGDKAEFTHRTTAQKVVDSFVVYPIFKMPLDLANSVIKGLKKIKPFKNSKTLKKWENNKYLKKRATYVKNKTRVAGIEHFFKKATDNESAFKDGHSRMNPNVANYSSPVERSLTRAVTGMGTALFLANDAYNLSKVLEDDDKLAAKAKKRRFKQETVRIGLTAGLTFATLKTFAKEVNKSGTIASLITAGTVVVSEVVGRAIAGNPILPVGEKAAKKYAEKHGKAKHKIEKTEKNDETNFRAVASDKHFKNKETVKTFGAFKGFDGKKVKVAPEDFKPPHKGKLTTENIMKVLGGLVVFGFAVDKGRKIKPVEKFLNDANKKYKSLYKKDFKVSRKEFNEITDKLEANGFDKVAKKYKEIVKDQKGNELDLGKVNHKVAEPVIHKMLTFPVRFVFDVAMLPYKKIVEPLSKMTYNKIKGIKPKKEEKTAEKLKKENLEMLRNSVMFLRKAGKKDDYKKVVSNSILESLDNKTKSSYSNAEMAVVAGTAARAASSGFLIADNYNMVMINSEGKDKDLAAQKARERTVQRASRIVYGAFLIKLFNGMFSPLYNKSLLGAQAVNVMNTGFVETFTRKSVGLPLGESSRDEIVKIEENNMKAKGIKGGYFRAMASLTGKKPLSERASKKMKKESKTA